MDAILHLFDLRQKTNSPQKVVTAREKIVPGHGPVCDLKEVQTYLGFFEPAAKIMKELIAEGRTQEEVVGFEGYPEFYASETPERRRDTLAQWYQVYKAKLGK